MQNEHEATRERNLNAEHHGIWPPKIVRLVAGAMVGAILAWLVLKSMYPIFVVPPDIAILPDPPPTASVEKLEKAQFAVDGKNFSIVFGLAGAVLGACCVLFTFGLRSIKAFVIAVVAASALGVAGANMSNSMFTKLRLSSGSDILLIGFKFDSMMQTIIGYAVLWGCIGLGIGLGIGSLRGIGKSITLGVSGLFGGLLGAMIYVLAIAQFMPNASMSSVFPPDTVSQMIWFESFATVVAVSIALGSGEKKQK